MKSGFGVRGSGFGDRRIAADTPVWADDHGLDLPVLSQNLESDLCVVGLGAAGLACIREARRLGLSVVGLDAGSVGGGASGRNGGFLLAGLQAFYHRACADLGRQRAWLLYRMSLGELRLIAEETPDCVQLCGSLRIAHDAGELEDCRAQFEAMQKDALPVEWYEGPEGEGLLLPTDGVFQPLARCRLQARRALAAGAKLFENSSATGVESGRIQTAHGSITCRHVVIAVDGGLERLVPGFKGRVKTARLQALATGPAPEISFSRPVYTRYGYDYWQQLPDKRIVLGGLRDIGGASEWTEVAEPTDAIQQQLDARLRALGVVAPVTHRWAGLTAYTQEGLPLFEEIAPKVLAVGAYGGTGNVLGPLFGRHAARWAAGAVSHLASTLEA